MYLQNQYQIDGKQKQQNYNHNKNMFNPQRKSKVSDIYMQQKWYHMHMNKIKQITTSANPLKQRERQQKQQQRYLKRLSVSKREVHSRVTNGIRSSNHKMFLKLLDTDNRKQDNPQLEYIKNRKKHFNSYFSSKKEFEKIKMENVTMVTRMMNSLSEVPTLNQCKLEHKINKKHQKRVRKLPSIFQHENLYKQKFSKRYLNEDSRVKSRVKSSRMTHLKLNESDVKQRQYELLSKELSNKMVPKQQKQKTQQQQQSN